MIPLFKVFMAPEAGEAVTRVLYSGHITQGQQVDLLEQTARDYFQHPYVVSINSATSGLTLAFRLLNLPPGSVVLSTPLTCLATNVPLMAHGLTIRWVDIDPHTCMMDLNDLERKLTADVRALLVVHWGGAPLDMDRVHHLVQTANHVHHTRIQIVEDCAHALGATYHNRKLGTLGNLSVFSLQAIKHVTAGDGGLLLVPTQEMDHRARLLRWFGVDRNKRLAPGSATDLRLEADVAEWGYKFHMNDLNATLALANFPYLDDHLVRAHQQAERYDAALRSVPGLCLLTPTPDSTSAHWIYTLLVADKPSFVAELTQRHVMVSQVHRRNDVHSCFGSFRAPLPQLDELESQYVCIPIGWWITPDQLEDIITSIIHWSRSTFRIRPLNVDDHLHYIELLSHMGGYKLPTTRDQWNERFQESGRGVYVLTCSRGTLLATGKLYIESKFGDPVGHIEDVVVHPRARHFHLGTALLDQLVERAVEQGCYKVVCECYDSVLPFYSKNHFQEQREVRVVRVPPVPP
jgi:dTDP-4-amino-4,6-dideoxygalactose transaminase/GNAT superfamily N-acetyltransferase